MHRSVQNWGGSGLQLYKHKNLLIGDDVNLETLLSWCYAFSSGAKIRLTLSDKQHNVFEIPYRACKGDVARDGSYSMGLSSDSVIHISLSTLHMAQNNADFRRWMDGQEGRTCLLMVM